MIIIGYVREIKETNNKYEITICSLKKGLLCSLKDGITLVSYDPINLENGMLYQFKVETENDAQIIKSFLKYEDINSLRTLLFLLLNDFDSFKTIREENTNEGFVRLSIESQNIHIVELIDFINQSELHFINLINPYQKTCWHQSIEIAFEKMSKLANISLDEYVANSQLLKKLSLYRNVYDHKLFRMCHSKFAIESVEKFFSIHSLSPNNDSLFLNNLNLIFEIILNNTESTDVNVLKLAFFKKVINFALNTYGSKISTSNLKPFFEKVNSISIDILDSLKEYKFDNNWRTSLLEEITSLAKKEVATVIEQLNKIEITFQIENENDKEYIWIESSNFGGDINDETPAFIEKMLALEIAKLINNHKKTTINFDIDEYFTKLEKESGLFLSNLQKEAIVKLFNINFVALLGKAGSGKSTTMSHFIKKYVELFPNNKIVVLSPTGAAAVVFERALAKANIKSYDNIIVDTLASDVTKYYNKIDLLIFEETSMINQKDLLKHFRNIKILEKVVFLGDYGQLPSINIGRIIESFLDSEVISKNYIIELDKSFREKSTMNKLSINDFANKIRDGRPIDDDLDIIKSLQSSVKIKQLDGAFDNNIKIIKDEYYSNENAIILSSTNIGTYGTKNINSHLQKSISNSKINVDFENESFAEGDPIVWNTNLKISKGIKKLMLLQNGANGIVKSIYKNSITLSFALFKTNSHFDALISDYKSNSINQWKTSWTFKDNLLSSFLNFDLENNELLITWSVERDIMPFNLFYCSTIHKVQGNQFDKVILLLDVKNLNNFTKKHIYTGLTRAMSEVVIFVFNNENKDWKQPIQFIARNDYCDNVNVKLGYWIDKYVNDFPYEIENNIDCKYMGQYYNDIHYHYDHQTKQFIFKEDVLNKIVQKHFIKSEVGGSMLGDVLELSKFASPTRVWMTLFGMKMPVANNTKINAGIELEPKIIMEIEKRLNNEKVVTFNSGGSNVEFEIQNRGHIGGRPDGYIESKKIVIEIKTTDEDSMQKWLDGNIPAQYIRQAQLYSYLLNTSKFMIVALFLKPEDYVDPSKVDISNRKIKSFNYVVNKTLVIDDINYVNKWYEDFVLEGKSPIIEYSSSPHIFEWLQCKSKRDREEWENKYINDQLLFAEIEKKG